MHLLPQQPKLRLPQISCGNRKSCTHIPNTLSTCSSSSTGLGRWRVVRGLQLVARQHHPLTPAALAGKARRLQDGRGPAVGARAGAKGRGRGWRLPTCSSWARRAGEVCGGVCRFAWGKAVGVGSLLLLLYGTLCPSGTARGGDIQVVRCGHATGATRDGADTGTTTSP